MEVLRVYVNLTGWLEVASGDRVVRMLPFDGTVDGPFFKGTILQGGVDTQKVDPEGIFHPQSVEDLDLSAEQLDAASEFAELQIKAYYDEKTQEFVIVQMAPDSELSVKGVEIGNRLIAADNKKIYGAEDLKIKLRQGADKGAIELKIKSGNGNIDVVKLKLGKQ